jgi:WD40 repeat protein
MVYCPKATVFLCSGLLALSVACQRREAPPEKTKMPNRPRLTEHSATIHSVAFSPDGDRILSGSGGANAVDREISAFDCTARLSKWVVGDWGKDQLEEVCVLRGHQKQVNAVAFTSDGSRAVTASFDSTIRFWDSATGQEVRKFSGHDGQVHAIALSRNDQMLLSGGYDGTVRVWNVASGEILQTFPHGKATVTSVAFSPDERHALCAVGMSLTVWDLNKGERVSAWHDGFVRFRCAAYSPDGRFAISCGEDVNAKNPGPPEFALQLWDVGTGNVVRRLEGHTDVVESVAFHRDEQRVLSGGRDGSVRLWDVKTGTVLSTFSGHKGWVNSVAISRDGRWGLSGGMDRTIRRWRLPEK